MIVWSDAKITLLHDRLSCENRGARRRDITQWVPQPMTRSAWAIAAPRLCPVHAVGVRGPLVPRALGREHEARSTVDIYVAQDLCSTVWAFACSILKHCPVSQAVAAPGPRSLSQFIALELARTAWSLSALQVKHVPGMNAVGVWAASPTRTFNPQTRANTAWSCAACLCTNPPVQAETECAGRAMAMVFAMQELARTAWSYAGLL
eukprot:NODE_9464_length_1423_cov_2.968364.p1 GENE.NODE_9464_length_1423_cov_2.968364~~NODE_9464_length_1423_cov_2.968364.p1  ORF type:complete len:237 (+),score=16.30 NODE_9464_length_1423_cov_2.968364:96-713(+)